jgi:predicted  nucleic acid-binding Zn-ribbon protein
VGFLSLYLQNVSLEESNLKASQLTFSLTEKEHEIVRLKDEINALNSQLAMLSTGMKEKAESTASNVISQGDNEGHELKEEIKRLQSKLFEVFIPYFCLSEFLCQ